jgi:hypothetical protein
MDTGPPAAAAARSGRPVARPVVAGMTGKHEVVDHERVLAGREQLRQPHVGRGAVRTRSLEDVVLRDDRSWGKLAPRLSHALHGAAQLDLPLEQLIARRSVLR